jgi:putative Mn2+ efflux pump MntP
MWQIFVGSVILSVIHALIPNHWIPLIAVSKSEKWSQKETLFATFVTGFAHTLSTVIIGIIVGFIGIKISENYSMVSRYAAPVILFVIGVVYVILDLRSSHHHHHEHFKIDEKQKTKSKWAILVSLSIAMFLTPCIEIEAYYFQAAAIGWIGILIVSSVYIFTTICIMLSLVYLGLKGVNKFNSHYLEHHEKRITGIVLIFLGILSFFIDF